MHWGFRFAPGAWNLNSGWHLLGALTFEIKHVMAFSNLEEDGCTIEKIESDGTDKRFFKVYIKDIKRKHIGQAANYRFHLIYSTIDGKLYKQTIKHNGETNVGTAIEIIINDYSVTHKILGRQ